jgi:hypothetical protein
VTTEAVERPIEVEPGFVPVGHYAHPDDPSGRTALCGQPILGVETGDTPHVLCTHCAVCAASNDWMPLP